MLLRVLKTLLRALPLLMGLVFTIYLILMHGPRLAVDGYVPLADLRVRTLISVMLLLVALALGWLKSRSKKLDDQESACASALLDESSERERALCERLFAWRQRPGGKLPSFLLMGPAGVDKGSLLGLTANADEDLRCSAVGGFALFEIGGNLASQRQPQEARLWRRLLDELGQSGPLGLRPRGIILVLSAARLLTASDEERDQIALSLRVRLEELANCFGKALTVQLIISECEQLPGYTESLAWLAADRRELSVEFAPAAANGQLLDSLDQRMNALVEGLDSSKLERLQCEPDVKVRSRLFGFIPMWRTFAVTLQGVLRTALAQERGIAQVALQSIRFSAHPPVLDEPAPALLRALQTCRRPGRVRIPLRVACAWWRPRAHYLALAASLLICLLLLNLHRDQGRRLEQVDRYITALQQAVMYESPATLGAGALLRLDRLAEIVRLLNYRWTPWAADRQLRDLSEQLYALDLRQVLLIDVLKRLQNSLQVSVTTDDKELRQNLGLYLMLGGEVRMNSRSLRDWYTRAGYFGSGGSQSEAQRLQLDSHMQSLLQLLALSGPPPLDRGLIEQVRHRLVAQPLAQRLYEQLLERMQGLALAEFSVASVLGAEGMLLFTRRSGGSLVEGVPALYTSEGYRQFETLLDPLLTAELLQERRLMNLPEVLAVAPIKREILALYHQDYIAHWEVFFDDLQIAGLDQHENLPRRLVQLAQLDSPIVVLLQAVARHTELAAASPPAGWLELAQKQTQRFQPGGGLTETDTPEHPVTRHFQSLHRWLDASTPAPQALLGAVKGAALFMQANRSAASLRVTVPPNDVLHRLQEEIDQLPSMLQPLFIDIAEVGLQQMQQRVRRSLANAWGNEVAPLCERALGGRYPFSDDSSNDVALEDFNQLFATGGVLQGFVTQHLAGQLDTRLRQWRVSETNEGETFDASLLLALEQAGQLREVFFPLGQTRAAFEFELSPLTMSAGIASFTLNVDGQRLDYRHGPLRSTAFGFPSKAFGAEIRASVTLLDGRTLTRRTEGAWAWFRLLDQINQIPTADPQVRLLVLDFEGEQVHLQMRVGRLGTPFSRDVFNNFRCPSSAMQAKAV